MGMGQGHHGVCVFVCLCVYVLGGGVGLPVWFISNYSRALASNQNINTQTVMLFKRCYQSLGIKVPNTSTAVCKRVQVNRGFA